MTVGWVLVFITLIEWSHQFIIPVQTQFGTRFEPVSLATIGSIMFQQPVSSLESSNNLYNRYPPPVHSARLSSLPYWSSRSNDLLFSVGYGCDQTIVQDYDYQQCRSKQSLNYPVSSNYNSESDSFRVCCILWATLYCMEETIRNRCDPSALHNFYVHKANIRGQAESKGMGICYSYPEGAFRCQYYFWMYVVALVVLVMFILITVAVLCWIWFTRNRKRLSSPSDMVSMSRTRNLVVDEPDFTNDKGHDVLYSQPHQTFRKSTRSTSNTRRERSSSRQGSNIDLRPTSV